MLKLILLALAASPAAGRLHDGNPDARTLQAIDLNSTAADNPVLYVGPPYCYSPEDFICYTEGLPACCKEEPFLVTSCSQTVPPPCDAIASTTLSTNSVVGALESIDLNSTAADNPVHYLGPPYCYSPEDFICYTEGLPACCKEVPFLVTSCSQTAPPPCDAIATTTLSTDSVVGAPESVELKCCDPETGPGGCPDENGSFDRCWDEGGFCCSDGKWYANDGEGGNNCQDNQLGDSLACAELGGDNIAPDNLGALESIDLNSTGTAADNPVHYLGPPYCYSPEDFICYTEGLPACCKEEPFLVTSCSQTAPPPCDAIATTTLSTNSVRGDATTVSTAVITADSATTMTLIGTSWLATEYFDGDSMVQLIPGSTITLSFDDEVLSGNSGCNSYSGTFDNMTTSSFEIGPVIVTRLLCDDEDLNSQEFLYLQNLGGTIEYTILDDGSLEFMDGGSNTIARYAPQNSSVVEGGTTVSIAVDKANSDSLQTTDPGSLFDSLETNDPESLLENSSPAFLLSTLHMVASAIFVLLNVS